jgi:hypothetical protein
MGGEAGETKQKTKKKHSAGMAYKANEDTKWSFITETLSTVVHGQLKNTYKEVAFVRVIISIFMKLVVRGLLLANELFY